MKTFKILKEYLDPVALTLDASTKPVLGGSVDDVDAGAHNIEQQDILDRLNGYLSAICSTPIINPYVILNKIWMKLNIIGLNFDLKNVLMPNATGVITLPLTQFGGRQGVLGYDDRYVSQDDGISNRVPGGLDLQINYFKNKGVYTIDAEIVPGNHPKNFLESEETDENIVPEYGIDDHLFTEDDLDTDTQMPSEIAASDRFYSL